MRAAALALAGALAACGGSAGPVADVYAPEAPRAIPSAANGCDDGNPCTADAWCAAGEPFPSPVCWTHEGPDGCESLPLDAGACFPTAAMGVGECSAGACAEVRP